MASDLIHQWIYIIAPTLKEANSLYFAAYCKGCNMYYTEPIPTADDSLLSPANLPRTGCDYSRAPLLEEGIISK